MATEGVYADPSLLRVSLIGHDPTKNVLDLVAAAIKRQDDLRASETSHLKELWQLQRHRMDHQQECGSGPYWNGRSCRGAEMRWAITTFKR